MTEQHAFAAAAPRPRAAARHKLFEPMVLRLNGAQLRAHMLDLSVSGALVHADRPPVPGDRVGMEKARFAVVGHVVWVRGKRFGVCFDRLLPDSLVQQVILGD